MKVKNYKFLFSALMLVLFLSQGNAVAGKINAEFSGAMVLIQKIDTKKRAIHTNGSVITYNSATVIYDVNGSQADAKILKEGIAIAYKYDKNKRYFLGPMATTIWIKSSRPM